jgi:hypothetical protein
VAEEKRGTSRMGIQAEGAAAYWRSFPVLEKMLQQEQPPVLERVKATCRQLDGILNSGSAQEKARAQEAMNAYARALELYQELVNRRNEMLAAAGNIAGAAHDK